MKHFFSFLVPLFIFLIEYSVFCSNNDAQLKVVIPKTNASSDYMPIETRHDVIMVSAAETKHADSIDSALSVHDEKNK